MEPFSPANHKWGVLLVVINGSFVAILDNTIVNVALPKMMANLSATVDQIEWVITGYMIAFAAIMPATGWLQEAFGLKKVFIIGLSLFVLGSALCGVAWDMDSLVVFRIIQAVGGGAMMPTGLALVSEAFPPEERGMAMGTWSIGAMVAPAVGPFLGGYLVDEVSWRSIFYINLPIGAVACLFALWVLPPGRRSPRAVRFDLIGFLSLSVFISALLIALNQGQREGWDSDYILACFGFSLVGLAAFLISARHRRDPLIDLTIFANRNFLMANLLNLVRAVGIFGSIFLLPLFLQNLLNYTALHTGVLLAPMAVSVALVSPASGFLSDRVGPRIPLLLGVLLLAFSLYLFKDLSLNSDYWFLFWPQVIRGLGLGLINAPVMSAALNAVRRDQTGAASGLLSITIQLGGAFGVALLAALLQRREFFHYSRYLQLLNDPAAPALAGVRSALEGALLAGGHSPAGAAGQAQGLLALWVQRLAGASAFADAFVLAGAIMMLGVIPALLIRRPASSGPPAHPKER